jgi:hypothetical protein
MNPKELTVVLAATSMGLGSLIYVFFYGNIFG